MPGTYMDQVLQVAKGMRRRKTEKDFADIEAQSELYRKAAQKAAYDQLGPEFRGSLDQATNYIAGLGPLADSGARTAIGSRLASAYLQRAGGQVTGGVADIIGNLIKQRQQYAYQSQLMQQQAKQNKKKWYDYAAGLAGGAAGGSAVGYV